MSRFFSQGSIDAFDCHFKPLRFFFPRFHDLEDTFLICQTTSSFKRFGNSASKEGGGITAMLKPRADFIAGAEWHTETCDIPAHL